MNKNNLIKNNIKYISFNYLLMKQALVLLIIMTLFSFMAGLACSYEDKIVCVDKNINTCRCAPKDLGGYFIIEYSCETPHVPVCTGNLKTVKCKCQ